MRILLFAGVFACAGSVRADPGATSVTVLGVRSLDGDDALARKVSQALRSAARELSEFRVSDRDVSLAQLALAHGCEEPDLACLGTISESLAADRLIFGNMERHGGEVRLVLFAFDAATERVDSKLERRVPAADLADGKVTSTLSALLRQLVEARISGAVLVVGDQPNAQVSLDGAGVGVLNARGELLLERIPVGEHAVAIEGVDGTRRELPVQVRSGARITLRVVLGSQRAAEVAPVVEAPEPSPDPAPVATPTDDPDAARRRRKIVAYTMAGLSAAMLGGAIYSWVEIGQINKNSDMRAYRAQFVSSGNEGGVSNVCDEAKKWTLTFRSDGALGPLESEARRHCKRAHALNTAQWVFVGGAVLAAGISTYLFATLPKSQKTRDNVRLYPQFGPGLGYLSASYRF